MSIPVHEVSREIIVKAARASIRATRGRGTPVSLGLARRVMKTARAHDRFLLGTWYRGDCGCLIGNMLGHGDSDEMTEAEFRIGLEFERLLSDFRPPVIPRTILEVTS